MSSTGLISPRDRRVNFEPDETEEGGAKPASFPSSFAYTVTFMCPSTEHDEARQWFNQVLKSCPYDHIYSSIDCKPYEDNPDGTQGTTPSKWGPKRFFVPHRSGIVLGSTPLLKSERVLAWSQTKWWTPLISVLVCVGMAMMALGSELADDPVAYNVVISLAGIIMSVTMAVYMSTYSREIFWAVFTGFEFWYLLIQAMLLIGTNAWWIFLHQNDDYVTLPFRILANLLTSVALLSMDASNASRQKKGVVMTVTTLGLITATFMWALDDTEYAMYAIVVLGFNVPLKTIAVTCLVVLAAFTGRYAVTCLFLRDDAMMLKFTPRWLRLEQIEVVPQWQVDTGDLYLTDDNHANEDYEDDTSVDNLCEMENKSMSSSLTSPRRSLGTSFANRGGSPSAMEALSSPLSKNRLDGDSVGSPRSPRSGNSSRFFTADGGAGGSSHLGKGGDFRETGLLPCGRKPAHKLMFRLEFRVSRWYRLHRRRIKLESSKSENNLKLEEE